MIPKDPLIGQLLANYKIERLLGHGGMAKVYLAWDVTLQRSVAVKVIDDRFRDDSAYSGRFLREARTMATWRHPNIPHVYNAGEEAGVLFFAMEYIRGQNLAQMLRLRLAQGELLSYAEILRIGRAVAEALDYAHQKGVIHRDVTPSNVILEEDGRVVLMDFGLALDVVEGTRGEVFGTPHYIAPEQARSSAAAVPQTDLYALGVMLYEMLTGVVPFDDPSPASLALKHMTEEPPPPSQINPQINPQVEAVLLIALRKDPAERYQSGKELMEALEDALYRQPATLAEVPAEAAGVPPTLAEIPAVRVTKPGVGAAAAAAGATRAGGIGSTIRRNRYLILGGLGCGLLLLVCSALLVRGATWMLGQQSSPTNTGQPGIATMIASIPARTRAAAVSHTPSTSPATTRTLTPSSSPSRTPTSTSSRTPTPSPTSTPSQTYRLVIVSDKDDSMFLVNEGQDRFPLRPLELRNRLGEVLGTEWKIEFLEREDCVAIWKEEGNPKPPKDLECDLVGERLERSGSEKFWVTEFEVYYLRERLGTCEPVERTCTVLIEVIER